MKKTKTGSGLIKSIFVLLVIVAIIVAVKNNINSNSDESEIEVDINNISKPVQKKATGSVSKRVAEYNVEITYVAKYSVSGRVVDVQMYYSSHIRDKLSPADVGLTWGFLAQEENHKKVSWSSKGNRYLYWYTGDGEWLDEIGGKAKITACYSNSHLLPIDDDIKKLIGKIKEDDIVKIDGYLVNVYCSKIDGSTFKWNTSTSRNDRGGGACEVIYVTNITWLNK